ncbi:hypothetical protein BO94DRAFT_426427, partial [Aspergillus sclerotioniger CBS 115572]
AKSSRASLKKLFRYSVVSEAPGGCSEYGLDALNAMADDAYTLAKEGLQAVKDSQDTSAATYAEADRLMAAMFLNPSSKRINGVKGYLENGGNTDNGQLTNRPFLLCGDLWRVRQDMSSQMRDSTGTLMEEDGKAIKISDIPAMVERQASVAKKEGVDPSLIYPYWSDATVSYTWDLKYGDGDPTIGPCQGTTDAIAFTITEPPVGIVVLCPKTFSGGRLHSVAAEPVVDTSFYSSKPPDDVTVQRIKAIIGPGSVLYHELFHLYWGQSRTTPSGNEEYSFRRMTGKSSSRSFTTADALKNPQTYAYMSLAYDYTLNVKSGSYPVEFYNGWATYK